MEKIKIKKESFPKQKYPIIINTEFSQLINPSPQVENVLTVDEFFELYDDLLATRKASDVEILRNELNKIGISVSHKVTYCFWKLYSQKSYSDWLSPKIFSSSIVTAFIEGYGVFDINSD